MPPSRFIRLTEEEDIRLREIEQDPRLKPKVRPRAQVLRLSHRGSNLQRPSPPTQPAAHRASGATSTAGRSGASRLSPTGARPATRRASPKKKRGRTCERGSPRSEPGERHATGPGAQGELRAGGDAGDRAPASAFDGLFVEAYPLCSLPGTGSRRGVEGQGGVGGTEKGAAEGRIVSKYLDERVAFACACRLPTAGL